MSEISELIKLSGMPKEAAEYCEEFFAKIKADSESFSLLTTAERRYMMGFDPGKEATPLHRERGFIAIRQILFFCSIPHCDFAVCMRLTATRMKCLFQPSSQASDMPQKPA